MTEFAVLGSAYDFALSRLTSRSVYSCDVGDQAVDVERTLTVALKKGWTQAELNRIGTPTSEQNT